MQLDSDSLRSTEAMGALAEHDQADVGRWRVPAAAVPPFLAVEMDGVYVQDGRLAVAVSNAGGLGSLPCALLSPGAARTELACTPAHTARPSNVNFFCHTPPARSSPRGDWRAAPAPYYRGVRDEANEAFRWARANAFSRRCRRPAGRLQAGGRQLPLWSAVAELMAWAGVGARWSCLRPRPSMRRCGWRTTAWTRSSRRASRPAATRDVSLAGSHPGRDPRVGAAIVGAVTCR